MNNKKRRRKENVELKESTSNHQSVGLSVKNFKKALTPLIILSLIILFAVIKNDGF
jgi:hypothetical protein